MIQHINLYRITQHYTVVVHLGTERNNFMPFQQSTLTLIRGCNNNIRFTILDADSKPINLNASTVTLVIYNEKTGSKITTNLTPIDIASVGMDLPSVNANNYLKSTFVASISSTEVEGLDVTSYEYKYSVIIDNEVLSINTNFSYVGDVVIKTSGTFITYNPKSYQTWRLYVEPRWFSQSDITNLKSLGLTDINYVKMYISDIINIAESKTVNFEILPTTGIFKIQAINEAVPYDDQAHFKWVDVEYFVLKDETKSVSSAIPDGYTFARVVQCIPSINEIPIKKILC